MLLKQASKHAFYPTVLATLEGMVNQQTLAEYALHVEKKIKLENDPAPVNARAAIFTIFIVAFPPRLVPELQPFLDKFRQVEELQEPLKSEVFRVEKQLLTLSEMAPGGCGSCLTKETTCC